ncbi:hypothetical protein BJ912DRAFT_1025140 [Pholiota molesta]|nr:hypothetical protein BJ912DRAFT_1025140 [Pholiota molesta]
MVRVGLALDTMQRKDESDGLGKSSGGSVSGRGRFWTAELQFRVASASLLLLLTAFTTIAIEGCCHGELDAIYSHIQQLETRNGYKVDALLICGDFQAIRNHQDLQCMAVPNKYRQLQHFYKYYTGEKASNYMWELYHGGWLAPNIYFLGHAGSVRLNGHYEKVPYDNGAMRSIYHIREYSVRKLSLGLPSANVFLSHDWPQSIEHHGDLDGLLRRKTFLRQDIEKGVLGSPPLMGLLRTLRPDWWFAAHLHTRYAATVVHEGAPPAAPAPAPNPDEIQIEDDEFDAETPANAPATATPAASRLVNPDEIMLEDEEEEVDAPPPPPAQSSRRSSLHSINASAPPILEVVDIPAPIASAQPQPGEAAASDSTTSDTSSEHRMPLLSFDPEWLAICPRIPDEAEARALVAKEREWVAQNIPVDARGEIPVLEHQVFTMTAPGPGSEGPNKFRNVR